MQTETKWQGTMNDAWIQTYTGQKVNVFYPEEKVIDIVDIAHALSMCTRFNGHLEGYYSVAEHSVISSYLVDPKYALAALMHDSQEAYLSDIPRPIKTWFPNIVLVEQTLMSTIYSKFKIKEWSKDIHIVDRRLCLTEAIAFNMDTSQWTEGENIYKPFDTKLIHGWEWREAKKKFLERFEELYYVD